MSDERAQTFDDLRDRTEELRLLARSMRTLGLTLAADVIDRAVEAYYDVGTYYSFLTTRRRLDEYETFKKMRGEDLA